VVVGKGESITYFLFVDDIVFFCLGNEAGSHILKEILNVYSTTIGMEVNMGKSTLYTWGINEIVNNI